MARSARPDSRIEIFWEDLWGWRIGEHRIPDPEFLTNGEPDWDKRFRTVEKYLRDAEDYWFHLYKPQNGDVLVDIGAGRGEDTYAFSKAIGPSGTIWSIEPH